MPAIGLSDNAQDRLVAPRQGNRDAFERLVERHRRELHVHCYRMLGSLHDADDALQETLLRAWRALPEFAGQRMLRPWLYKIATNVTIDMSRRRRRRSAFVEPYPDQFVEPEDDRPAPETRYEQREAVELAFVAALQNLPGRQRAVLVLREVLGFSAAEVADLLGATVAAVNSALQRARLAVENRLPERSQQAALRSLGDVQVRHLAETFADAWDRGDVAAMVSMLTDDVVFTMPPEPPRRRSQAVAEFLPAPPAGRWRLLPTSANGQLAFGAYRREDGGGRHSAAILDVVTLREAKIAEVVAFTTPELFARFGLPRALPAGRKPVPR